MNVLIVEDESKTREGLKKLICMFHPSLCVHTAPDADTALKMAKETRYNLIFTDIRMPGMDGLEMLEYIERKNAQIVVISSYADFSYAQQAMKVDVQEYLLKPVDPMKFRQTLDKAVKKYCAVRNSAFRTLMNEWEQLSNSAILRLEEQMNLDKEASAVAWVGKEGKLSEQQIQYCQKTLSERCDVGPTDWIYVARKNAILLCLSTATWQEHQRLKQEIEKNTPEFCHFVSTERQNNPQMLLEEIHRLESRSQEEELNPQKNVIRVAKKYVQEHLSENILLNDIAQVAYVHPTYLSKLFKKETGQNISDYITECRIEKAKQCLKQPEYKIYEIAKICGFQDVKYFGMVFKSAVGCTPSKYRNENE